MNAIVRVLIVEDDPMVASINQRLVEKVGSFQVVGVVSGERDALQLIQAAAPDLVLLDVFLPYGNGVKILQDLRQGELPVDVILVTAANDTRTIYQCLRLGAIDYIIKPFDLERLEASLNNYRKLRSLLSGDQEVSQTDIDDIGTKEPHPAAAQPPLPKGIHPLTLDQVTAFLLRQQEPLSSDEIAEGLSMSKITVWRYLEYLVERKMVQIQQTYGTIGRPKRLYSISPAAC